MLVCVWWMLVCCLGVWRMEERLYEAFFIASAFVSVSAMTISTLFPTYVVRPALSAGIGRRRSWAGFMPMIMLQCLSQWSCVCDYLDRAFLVALVSSVALVMGCHGGNYRACNVVYSSHYLPDPVGGLALAWFGYRLGLWCVTDNYPVRQPVVRKLGILKQFSFPK